MQRKILIFVSFVFLLAHTAFAQKPLKVFISVDMEGIGGIGTAKMVREGGKDYATGRKLMTDEVKAIVDAIYRSGPASVLVNDSHGDMQNLLHTELDERVIYIQGNIKPFGMVQGLDSSFDAVIFLGYHTRAGADGFLAHTGSGAVKGLWLNDIEVGEGGLNAAYAGELGVPVILASGDLAFTDEITRLVDIATVATKEAVSPKVAKLTHPNVVTKRLSETVTRALGNLGSAKTFTIGTPVRIRMRFATTTQADVLQAIPAMTRVDGYTVGLHGEEH